MKIFMFFVLCVCVLGCDDDLGEFQKNTLDPTIGTYYIVSEAGPSTYSVTYENEFGVMITENNIVLPWEYQFTQDHTGLYISVSGPVPHYDMIVHANRGVVGVLEMACTNPPCTISADW